jgi:hypothetical protein
MAHLSLIIHKEKFENFSRIYPNETDDKEGHKDI